ncbi:MAG: hypothetical protein ACM3SW_11120 [Actinomycetota bacterium]
MNILAYFRVPFPSREGFSAYRSPGLAAHIPFFLLLLFLGLMLCGLSPLLAVWAVAGLYLGRDIAILCHYAPLLFLVLLAGVFTLLYASKPIALFGRQHPAAGVGLTALVLVTQLFVAWRAARSS